MITMIIMTLLKKNCFAMIANIKECYGWLCIVYDDNEDDPHFYLDHL